jgi:hypothetical protein
MTVDPNRCPDCGGTLTGAPHCAECGLLVRGPLALRLWQVDNEIDRLTQTRATLVAALRPGGIAPTAPTVPTSPSAPPAYRAPAPQWTPPKPRQEWTPQRVQNLLLATGALLLVVAAIAFTAFQWGRLPIPARGALMLAATGVAAWSAHWTYRRGLTASAEAIGLIAVLFGAIDAYAAHRANLAGLRDVDPATYWSVASGVLAAASAAYGRVLPVRSVRYAALAGIQLPLLITAFRIDGLTAAERGAFLTVQAAALGAAAYRLGGTAYAARVAGAVNWAAATLLALTTAYESGTTADVRVAALVLLATGAAALLWPGDRTVPAGVATAYAVVAAMAPAALELTTVQLPAAIAAAGLLAVVAGAVIPYAWRLGPVAVGTATVAVSLAAVAPWVLQVLVLPFSWAGEPWGLAGDRPVREAIAADGTTWGGSVVALGVVAVAALTAVLAAELAGRRRDARWVVVTLASSAVLLGPLGFATSYRVALAWYVAAGAGGLTTSFVLRRVVVAAPATIVLAVATAWSLADEGATLVVLVAVAMAYGAYAAAYATPREPAAGISAAAASGYAVALALSRGVPVERAGFVLATAAFALMAAGAVLGGRVRSVEGVAGAAYVVALGLAAADPGWLAWTLGGGALVAGASAFRPGRRGLASPAAALAIACAGTAAYAFGAPLDRTGFVVALAAAAAVGVGALLRGPDGDLVELVAGAAYAVAVLLAADDLGWLSWVLAAGGVTALANALRADRRWLNWVATVLLTAWSWDRLYLADVDVPEAYAAPVAALALALGHLRRRREPETGSWTAYGRGLAVAFAPTTYLVVADPGVTRPVLLGIAGLAVLLAGVRERLQAPLTIGAAALAVDALVQLAPVAAALPKWATIGAAGLVVIAVGVTYEDRRRDVTRLREAFESFG